MTATNNPSPMSYGAAIELARAELDRIMDHLEDNRHLYDDDFGAWERMNDVARGMWTQMTWTIAQVYGVEYEYVEGCMSVLDWDPTNY